MYRSIDRVVLPLELDTRSSASRVESRHFRRHWSTSAVLLAAEMAGPLSRLNCLSKGNFGKKFISLSVFCDMDMLFSYLLCMCSAVIAIV